jgi:peptide/nickel transport system substrate-binding protein
MPRRGISLLCVALLALGVGCNKSNAPLGGKPKSAGGGKASTASAHGQTGEAKLGAPKGWKPAEEDGKSWVGYPDVPYVPVMTEVDGIEIPRVAPDPGDFVVGGEAPADVGNPAAKGQKTEAVTGGTLTMRVEAEPNSLNPITDSSAYGQFFNTYTHSKDGLLWQNWETFEFEPHLAKKWVVEDSVKLRPDFPGRERRVAAEGGEPEATLSVEVKANPAGEPQPIVLRTTTVDGMPAGKTWIGLRPKSGGGDLQHFWSDDQGRLEAAPAAGKYDVLVSDELYGDLVEEGDGYVLKSLTDAAAEPVKLAKTDIADVQRKTVFTYYLREDVTWSDGRPFTSKDLEFAYAAINNPFVDGDSVRVYYADVVECRGLSAHTVRMKYRSQYFLATDFTSNLALYTPPFHVFEGYAKEKGRTLVFDRLSPEEEDARNVWSVHGQQFGRFFNEEDRYNRKPIGYGPYVVSDWSQQNKRLVLERRKDYWDKEHAGYLDRIVVKFIEDYPTALAALRAGEIDLLWRPTAEQFFKELAGQDWVEKNYVRAGGIVPSFSYVGWNMRKPMFKDRRVRLALAMLFDKREFFEKNVYNAGVLVSGSQYFYGPQYDHSVRSVGYNPSAARDLLAEAGWVDTDGDGLLDREGEPFRFTLLVPPGNPTTRALIEVMQQNYQKAGIDVDVLEMEWASYLERVKSRQFDVCTMSWMSSPESDPFQIWHGSQADPKLRSSNHVGFENAAADRLIEKIRVTLDPEERRRLFYSFHRIIDSEQPYDFLWTRREFVVYHQKSRGVKLYALRPGFDLRAWYVPRELQ